jgi:predicted N-acetyltransferase YhbS
VFITRATRHDRADIESFLEANGWHNAQLSRGATFFARDGGVVGTVRLVEVEPRTVVVNDVVVDSKRQGEGIGRALMQTAMNSRGGTLYLACHDDTIAFYEKFGFAQITPEDMPASVVTYMKEVGDYPTEGEHYHFFMRAR